MLTDETFRQWCQHNHISPTSEAVITRIRSSPPARRVRGRASNVSGRYPSVKMDCTIQFESLHVELWAIYAMERDNAVLEYYASQRASNSTTARALGAKPRRGIPLISW